MKTFAPQMLQLKTCSGLTTIRTPPSGAAQTSPDSAHADVSADVTDPEVYKSKLSYKHVSDSKNKETWLQNRSLLGSSGKGIFMSATRVSRCSERLCHSGAAEAQGGSSYQTGVFLSMNTCRCCTAQVVLLPDQREELKTVTEVQTVQERDCMEVHPQQRNASLLPPHPLHQHADYSYSGSNKSDSDM